MNDLLGVRTVTRDYVDTVQIRRTSDWVVKSPSAKGSITLTASDDSKDRYGDRILVDGFLNGKRFGDGGGGVD